MRHSVLRRRAAGRLSTVPRATVWSEFTPLATKHNAVNLGQGFPSFMPEKFIVDEATKALNSSDPLDQQYCRGMGHLALVDVLRARYSSVFGRDVKPTEIQVTNGTTQALNVAFQATLGPEDEVIVFEPFFDVYNLDVTTANGTPRYVSLKPQGTIANEWSLDEDELARAIGPKTKGILVNTPQNVPGKVWSKSELEVVARLAKKHDLLVYADEVYDRLTYDGEEHTSIASLPGMFDRTITMCSSSKTLTATGWKIGWCVAPEDLALAMSQVMSLQSFCVCTPLQIGVGRALAAAEENGYFQRLHDGYLNRRGMLLDALSGAGLECVKPQGGFFVLADISSVSPDVYMGASNKEDDVGKDWHFCRWVTKEIGVNAIPVTAFCQKESRPLYEKYARFAFCKSEQAIEEAAARLTKVRQYTL